MARRPRTKKDRQVSSGNVRFAGTLLTVMNAGPRLVMLILPIEILLVTFCPPIQIFGPNPLREWMADHLPNGMGHHVYHLAGALTDFKKLLIYSVCAFQIVVTRALVRSHTNRNERQFFGIRLTPEEIGVLSRTFQTPVRRVRVAGWVVTGLWAAYFGFQIVRIFILPSMTDHVFGPVGKGAISVFTNPTLHWYERLPLVAYRSWYELATLIMAAITVLTALPSVVLAVTYRPGRNEADPPAHPPTIPPLLLMFIGVPVFALMGIATLWTATELLGVGELGGRSFEGALVALVALVIWSILGFKMGWKFRELPGPFHQLQAIIRRAAYAAGLCLLIIAPADWISKTYLHAHVTVAVLRCEAINRITEYEGWRIDKARPLIAATQSKLSGVVQFLRIADSATRHRIAASIFRRDSDFQETVAKKLDNDGELVDLLTSSVLLSAMLDTTLSGISSPPIPYQVSADEIISRLDAMIVSTNGVGPIPWTYDPSYIRRYRVTSLRSHLLGCKKRKFEAISPHRIDELLKQTADGPSLPIEMKGEVERIASEVGSALAR